MIAEKAADAIKGRKLNPFEPPTRIAANLYGAGRPSAPIYTAASAHEPVQYRQPKPMPLPPPMGQIYPDQLRRTFMELGNYSSTAAAAAAAVASINQYQNQYQHHQFIANRYATSTMADQLIKRMHPAR